MNKNPATLPSKRIDDYGFRVDMLDLGTAEEVFVRVARGVGPSLEELARAAVGVKSVGDLDVGKSAGALSKLLAALTVEDLRFMREAFAHVTQVQIDPTRPVWMPLAGITDQIFRGKLLTMSKWLAFAFSVNFADFLKGVRVTGLQSPTPLESEPSLSASPTE